MSASRAVGGVVLAEPGFAQRLAGLRQEEAQLDGVVALGLKIEDGTPTPAARHRLGKHAGDFTARGRDFRLRCLLPGQLAEPPAVELDDELHQPRRTRLAGLAAAPDAGGHHAGAFRRTGLVGLPVQAVAQAVRSEEHTSELQSLMRISYAVFCLKKKTQKN